MTEGMDVEGGEKDRFTGLALRLALRRIRLDFREAVDPALIHATRRFAHALAKNPAMLQYRNFMGYRQGWWWSRQAFTAIFIEAFQAALTILYPEGPFADEPPADRGLHKRLESGEWIGVAKRLGKAAQTMPDHSAERRLLAAVLTAVDGAARRLPVRGCRTCFRLAPSHSRHCYICRPSGLDLEREGTERTRDAYYRRARRVAAKIGGDGLCRVHATYRLVHALVEADALYPPAQSPMPGGAWLFKRLLAPSLVSGIDLFRLALDTLPAMSDPYRLGAFNPKPAQLEAWSAVSGRWDRLFALEFTEVRRECLREPTTGYQVDGVPPIGNKRPSDFDSWSKFARKLCCGISNRAEPSNNPWIILSMLRIAEEWFGQVAPYGSDSRATPLSKAIKACYDAGMRSPQKIADYLAEQGMPTSRQNVANAIRRIALGRV